MNMLTIWRVFHTFVQFILFIYLFFILFTLISYFSHFCYIHTFDILINRVDTGDASALKHCQIHGNVEDVRERNGDASRIVVGEEREFRPL